MYVLLLILVNDYVVNTVNRYVFHVMELLMLLLSITNNLIGLIIICYSITAYYR